MEFFKKYRKVKWTISLCLCAILLGIFALWARPSQITAHAEVNVPSPRLEYEYNERVPVDIIRAEIRVQASRYGISIECMDRMVFDESGYDNLAKNPGSTALGVAQYLIGTWQETVSFREDRKARTDYKASLKEMALDLASGEEWRWDESRHKWIAACDPIRVK